MSWLQKLLPPKIQRTGAARKSVPEGLWTKCAACDAVLYSTDLEKNLNVCPKCGHHERLGARPRLDALLDADGRFEIGSEVLPVDTLKFKDTRRYPERLSEAQEETAESDALVVMQGSIKELGVVCAAFEFDFMGGSMGSVVGERFVRGVRVAIEQKLPFVCVTSSGGARMQEGLLSLAQMAKTTAASSQAMTWALVPMSGAGMSRYGPSRSEMRPVKDRVTGHNPLAPLYTSRSYYQRLARDGGPRPRSNSPAPRRGTSTR